MWHLFKTRNKKQYDFAFISKGRYIAGSKQGYSRRIDAAKALYHLLITPVAIPGAKFTVQDDTDEKPVIGQLASDGTVHLTGQKPGKPYRFKGTYRIPLV